MAEAIRRAFTRLSEQRREEQNWGIEDMGIRHDVDMGELADMNRRLSPTEGFSESRVLGLVSDDLAAQGFHRRDEKALRLMFHDILTDLERAGELRRSTGPAAEYEGPDGDVVRDEPAWRLLAPAAPTASLTPKTPPVSAARHTPDFRSVHWYGNNYAFTAMQAACVKVLWEAMDNGTRDVGDHYLLAEASSDTRRVADLFRDHPAWGTMIVAGATKGTRRLADPPRP